MNKIILIGRLTKDPTLTYTPSGYANSRMTLAVDRRYKDKQGNQQTDFVPIVAWQKLAETVAQYMKKGKQIAVEGSLEIRTYEKDNQKMYISEVIASDIRFLDKIEKKGE